MKGNVGIHDVNPRAMGESLIGNHANNNDFGPRMFGVT